MVKLINEEENQNLLSNKSNESNKTSKNSSEDSFHITEKTTKFDVYKGFIYMLLSCIFRSIFSFLCKWSLNYNKELTPYHQITLFNYFYFTITLISFSFSDISIFSDKFLNKKKLGLIIIRNILAISSIVFLTTSLKFIHISDVFSIFYIYPMLVLWFSVAFLNEKSWWFDYICCVACIVGAVLIVRPEFIFHDREAESKYEYFLFVSIAAVLKACEDVTTRKIGKGMHYQAINLFYTSIGMVVFPLIVVFFHNKLPTISFAEYFVFFLTGLCAYLYQTLATIAFQNESAGRASMINFLQVDFMYIIDLWLFDKDLILSDLIGTLLIFSFNFANGTYKTMARINRLNEELERKRLEKERDNLSNNISNHLV